MRHARRLFPIALLIATCANAEFSAEEKEQMKRQIESLQDVVDSFYWATVHAGSNPDAADEVASFIGFGSAQWRAHFEDYLRMLDMIDVSIPRADLVADTLADLADNKYSFVGRKLQAVPGTSHALTAAREAFERAVQKRTSIDTTLAYTEPRMASNLAMPGATRLKSGATGPHGDYLMVGNAATRWARDHASEFSAVAGGVAACPAWVPGSKPSGSFTMGHIKKTATNFPVIVSLAAGIEADFRITHNGLTISENLDRMHSAVSGRDRSDMNIQLSLEMKFAETHTGPEPYDVTGRHTSRGLAYDLGTVGSQWISGIRNWDAWCPTPEAGGAFVDAMADGAVATYNLWRAFDDMGYHGELILKFFSFVPPPTEDNCATCGTGTTLVDGECVSDGTGGDCPPEVTCGKGTTLVDGVCVPDPVECPTCPPEVTCGEGTTLVDGVCVANSVECPSFAPVLDVLPDAIQARCVESP